MNVYFTPVVPALAAGEGVAVEEVQVPDVRRRERVGGLHLFARGRVDAGRRGDGPGAPACRCRRRGTRARRCRRTSGRCHPACRWPSTGTPAVPLGRRGVDEHLVGAATREASARSRRVGGRSPPGSPGRARPPAPGPGATRCRPTRTPRRGSGAPPRSFGRALPARTTGSDGRESVAPNRVQRGEADERRDHEGDGDGEASTSDVHDVPPVTGVPRARG